MKHFLSKNKAKVALGVLLLLAAGGLWIDGTWGTDFDKYTALKLPTKLRKGALRTPEFAVTIDGRFFVQIAGQRTVPFARLECMLGICNPCPREDCKPTDPLVVADWKVWEGDSLVASDDGAFKGGGWSSREIERSIGYFDATAGHSYVLELNVQKDAIELDQANPVLRVQTHPGAWKGEYINAGLELLAAKWLAFAGVFVLLLIAWAHVRKRRQQDHR